MKRALIRVLLAGLLGMLMVGNAWTAIDANVLYQKHCAECHGADRLGKVGPALLPQNLKRLRKKAAFKVIRDTRPASQMPAFREILKPKEIEALVAMIYTPLKEIPPWGMEEIKASRLEYHPPGSLPDKPQFDAQISNLFMVVELGDHHATLLNGDSFEPIHRLPTRFALHGGPKWAEGGRYIYFASRDGWISKFDVFNLKYVAEVRAGINTRNLAVSHDGRYVAVANYLPHTLVILDARDLSPLKVIDVVDENGASSRVSAVYTADPRESFVAALKDIPEVWEIGYMDKPPSGFSGWVHDYREDSGDAHKEARFPVRRISVEGYLDDFFLTQEYDRVIGTSRGMGKGKEGSAGQVVDLDLKRAVAQVSLPGMPHLSSAITWEYQGRTVLATPNIKRPEVSIVDMQSWEVIKRIPTKGPGFFMRSHEKSRYAWVDVFFGPNKDLMHVIDKQTLEIVKTLKPAPGKTSAHVEFTQDGKYALVSIWDMDGALVIYDANTLEEVKRLPMKKPSGKYNVHNKLTRSRGTSH
ncbi:nitrite reductase [endosymbiont of Ridgeia piscesae]|jgi:cytochrome c551/c552/DNA-binding beta-propeller fold protein YncE|uniref:Cytochrome C oxidase, cbb3-type, subunit III n=1 Tax=endosymbiont of Ridgeia piscesae TaxID=54398 RepID=A0A0T5YUX8_9GAMM|nr:nitrite reductase [endosymbiont of Ridgeia piscesae]KRT53909.1 Cytochrome C oxidase, cbb3-type, subunit III/Cytochrome D1 heme domain [endosymbiont of Ridgeia piscesae]KRT58546.1 Cytochrome C oxidase, cbb3-type, subunit III [endosymbiont of Ridgeia piscesae]